MHFGSFVTTVSLVAAMAAPVAPRPGHEVRILDWNINKGKRFTDIAHAIRAFNPELCLLQEVDANARRSGKISVTGKLGQELGYTAHFTPAFRELAQGPGASPAWLGQGLLTRLPVRKMRSISFHKQTGFWLPRWWIPNWPIMQRREGGRTAQVAELDTAGGTLAVYNLHLESRSGPARRAQLEETLADARRYGPGTAVLIAGDLNTQFGAKAYLAAFKREGFRNCFGDERPRTHRLIGKVDWIFVRGPVDCQDARVHPDIHGSDHFPITARLILRSVASTGGSPAWIVPLAMTSRRSDADVRRFGSQTER